MQIVEPKEYERPLRKKVPLDSLLGGDTFVHEPTTNPNTVWLVTNEPTAHGRVRVVDLFTGSCYGELSSVLVCPIECTVAREPFPLRD